jgi:hypothetical protein
VKTFYHLYSAISGLISGWWKVGLLLLAAAAVSCWAVGLKKMVFTQAITTLSSHRSRLDR